MVVISGVAVSAGSSFSAFAPSGSRQPIHLESTTVASMATDTVNATSHVRPNTRT